MAADGVPSAQQPPANPCCSVWKGKCSKLVEGRKYLRQAVNVLNEQADKIQADNVSLKKAFEEEKAKAEREKEGRVALENEVCSLKLEVSLLRQKADANDDGKRAEIKLLQGRVSDGEKVIEELKRLVEKEKARADAERKRAEAEKKSAAEAWKLVKVEKVRADEERKLANVEGKKAEEYRLQLEEVNKVADEANAKLASQTLMLEDMKQNLEDNRCSVLEERKKSEFEREEVDELRCLVQELEKNFKVEKSRADGLALQLEDARQRIELLQIQVEKCAVPQNPSEPTGNLCSAESNDFDTGSFFENIDKDENVSNLVLGFLASEDAIESIKVEKQKVQAEKNRADLALVEAEEQRKLAEENKKLAAEEKLRADHLSLHLQESLGNSEALQKQIHEILSRGDEQTRKIKLLDKELMDAKQKAAAEKKHTDSAMKSVEEHKKLVEVCKKMATEEKTRADQLSLELGKDRLRIEELKKQVNQLMSCRNILEAPAVSPRRGMAPDVNKFDSRSVAELEPAKGHNFPNIDTAKNGERRRLVEENKMMAAEEKLSAEEITCQLKEDRKRINEMQKQIQLLIASKNMVQSSVVLPGKSSEVKCLERQLKHEKKRLKHAKQEVKMEKGRNLVLLQEFDRLKLDFVQIFSRLDMMGQLFSPYADETKGMEKTAELTFMQSSKLRNPKDFATHQADARSENEILKHSGMAVRTCDSFGQALHSTAPCFPLLGGKVMESVSGIDSEMEPLIGGSNRQLLQSSVMNSSSASFSDDQLMGSQEKGANVITSPNMGQVIGTMQPKVPDMSGEVTELQQNNNLAIRAPNGIVDMQCINVAKMNALGQTRRIPDVSTFGEVLSSGKNLHAMAEDKRVVSQDMSKRKRKIQKSLKDNMEERRRIRKKTESSHEQKSLSVHFTSNPECKKTRNVDDKACHDANLRQNSSFSSEAVAVPSPFREGFNKHFEFHMQTVAGLEEVNGDNYMRLLDLDNASEEAGYRRALEMPLSPSLPEVRLPDADLVNMYADKPTKDESLNRESLYVNQMSSSNSCNAFEVDISSNNVKSETFGTSNCEDLSNKDLQQFIPYDSSDILQRRVLHNCQPDVSIEASITMNKDFSIDHSAFLCGGKVGSAASNLQTSIDLFADVKDSGSIHRVFCASRDWIPSCIMETETRSMLQKVLHALKNESISTKEKACVFVTILVHYLLAYIARKTGSFFGTEFVHHVDAIAKEIISVLSDYHTRNIFKELFCLEELLATIQNFLIDGRVMRYADPSSVGGENSSTLDLILDGKDGGFLLKSASVEQLLVGSIILASICEATDCVGFICEVSYNLLREQRCNDSVTLLILHIFAHLGREKLFSLKQYLSEMTVLNSIVMLLEGANSSCVRALSSSLNNVIVQFHPMDECPFSRNAIPVDNLAIILLEKLLSHPVSHGGSANSSHCNVLSQSNKSMLGSLREEFGSPIQVDHDASCGLTKWFGDPSDMVTSHMLCDLCDILSLLELLASRMSWEWTCAIIVPKLLEVLGDSKLDFLVIGVISLLGQIGRLGVGSYGFQDKGVEIVRHKLSSFLQWETTVRVALPVQITAVSALLGLLAIDFRQVVQGSSEKSGAASQSVYVDLIRSWFSLLDKDQQALTLDLLQSVVPGMR